MARILPLQEVRLCEAVPADVGCAGCVVEAKMKALSMTAPYGQFVRDGYKSIETRKYGTEYRGPILFCCTKSSDSEDAGMALCVADVVDIRMMTKADEFAACCTIYPKARAWILANVRRVKPFPVKGKLSIFEVDDSLIEYEEN